VRGITFYLLRKSFDDIGKEAAVTYPLVAMDAFIDKLDVSKELKAWMKKNQLGEPGRRGLHQETQTG
jgi:hypothetical protein